jgi:hypothetical protein
LEALALDVLGEEEEPEIYAFKRPVVQPVEPTPVEPTPVEQWPVVSRDDPLTIPAVEDSTLAVVARKVDLFAEKLRTWNVQLAEKMEELNVSPATLLLVAVPSVIGITLLALWLLSVGGLAFSSKAQAQAFLVSELDKWVANQPSAAKTIDSLFDASPVSYEIKSLHESEPLAKGEFQLDQFSSEGGEKLVVTYRANVELEFESKAHTPLHKVVRYRLMKYSPSGQWRMAEGDSMLMGSR